MIDELKSKLAPKNQLVKFYQEGKLTDEEFYKLMDKQTADKMRDEQEEISWEEAHNAIQTKKGWQV
jgi:hypothetical protein